MSRLFLSEYVSELRTAQVYKNLDSEGFVVLGYQRGQQVLEQTLTTEWAADDVAEDWVTASTNE